MKDIIAYTHHWSYSVLALLEHLEDSIEDEEYRLCLENREILSIIYKNSLKVIGNNSKQHTGKRQPLRTNTRKWIT